MQTMGIAHGWPAAAHAAIRARIDANWAQGLRPCDAARRARARECLRRIAGASLASGASLESVGRALGISPGKLVQIHAEPFDPAESPLKARRLDAAAALWSAALRHPGHLHGRWPGLRAKARCAGSDCAGMFALASQVIEAYAVEFGAEPAVYQWFDFRCELLWTWSPEPGSGFGPLPYPCDGVGSTVGAGPCASAAVPRTADRAGRSGLAQDVAVGPLPDAGSGTVLQRDLPPPGAGWDLLLHAAHHGLPLDLRLGSAAVLTRRGPLHEVRLEGQALRVDAGPLTIWLTEDVPVVVQGDAAAALCTPDIGAALGLDIASNAAREQICAWRRLVSTVLRDQPVPACSC